MARWIIRKPSFWKTVGAYRSQWKRAFMRLLFPGTYGRKGMGWLRNPRKAAYNWFYHRTSYSLSDILTGKGLSSNAAVASLVLGLTVSLFFLPFDIFAACVTGSKVKKSRKRRETARKKSAQSQSKQSSQTGTKTKSTANEASKKRTPEAPKEKSKRAEKDTTPKKSGASKCAEPQKSPQSEQSESEPRDLFTPEYSAPLSAETPTPEKPIIIDENTPKSKPKNEKDQYIKKRMVIAGSYYADQEAVSKLIVGTYLQLKTEPDNPYDKNAVALYFEGEKVGYVAKDDVLPISTCLKLNRSIYGVITDIREENGRNVFEYEAWFE